jgi:hypothetical protein
MRLAPVPIRFSNLYPSQIGELGRLAAGEEPKATGAAKKVADLSIGDMVLIPGRQGHGWRTLAS